MELDLAHTILTTLQYAARCAPVPYLQEAASLALGILQVISDVKSNQEGLIRLANDSCELVYVAICAHSGSVGVSPVLGDNLANLIQTLTAIYSYTQKELKRGFVTRLIRYRLDQEKILEYRGKLRQSLDLFVLQSLINIQRGIGDILHKQDEILRRLPYNEFRIVDPNAKS